MKKLKKNFHTKLNHKRIENEPKMNIFDEDYLSRHHRHHTETQTHYTPKNMKGHTQETLLNHHKNQLLKLPFTQKDPKCAHIFMFNSLKALKLSLCVCSKCF